MLDKDGLVLWTRSIADPLYSYFCTVIVFPLDHLCEYTMREVPLQIWSEMCTSVPVFQDQLFTPKAALHVTLANDGK